MNEIEQKAIEVYNMYLSREKKDRLSCSYRNCRYNYLHRISGQGMIGFCTCKCVLDEKGYKVFVCNDTRVAKNCKYYECKNTSEQVEKEFEDNVREPSVCGEHYPKLAVLLWVLKELELPDTEIRDVSRYDRFKLSMGKLWGGLVDLLLFRWIRNG